MCKWQEYICSLNDIVVDTSGFLGILLYDEKSLLHQVLNIIGDQTKRECAMLCLEEDFSLTS